MRYKNLLYILLILFSACKTNNKPKKEIELIKDNTVSKTDLMPRYETDLRKEKLNGPVKEYRNFKKYTTSITEKQRGFYYVLDMLNVFSYNGYYIYDKNGIQKSFSVLRDSITYKNTYTFNGATKEVSRLKIYDLVTFNKIKEYQQQKIPKNIYNPYRLKLDVFDYINHSYEVKKDSSFKELLYIYKYTFDTHKKILTEIKYQKWNFIFNDRIIDREEVEYTVNYKYNAKGQLVTKEYVFIKDKGVSENTLDHDISLYTYYSPVEDYTYDEAGNLTSVYTYGMKSREFVIYSADYFYNKNNELVKLRRRKSDSQSFAFSEYRVTHDFYYNKNGEITKINTYEADEKTIHATFLFEYKKHDKYNNWLQCNMYLDGIKTETPTAITERIIEYYNE